MKVELTNKDISTRKITSVWDDKGIDEFLKKQFRKNRNNKNIAFIGVKVQEFLDKFLSDGDRIMKDDDNWKSRVMDKIMEILSSSGFSSNSTIDDRSKPIEIKRVGNFYLLKVELSPGV